MITWDHFKQWGDYVAVGVATGVVVKFLPLLLGLPSFIYSCIRIYEWWKGRKHGNVKLD